MALPNTGPLSLNSIRTELNASSINVSLRSLSNTAGFTTPDSISEFYGYSDGISLGLTSPIHSENLSSSNTYSFKSHTLSSDYVNYSVRVVWEYTNGTSGTSYRGDFQLDDMNLFGNSFDPENGIATGWQTSTSNTSSYNSVSFTNLANGSTGGRWNRDDSGTTSYGTGISGGFTGDFYYYAETTGSSTSGHKYWLKSPEITITSNNLAISYYIGHLGDNVGSYNVYLDVISFAIPLVLTSPIHSENLSSSNTYSFKSHTLGSEYIGRSVRVVWEYTNGTSGTSFRGDFQLDDMNLFGNGFDPENGISSGWQTSTSNTSSYNSVSFTNLANGSTGGRWNRDGFGTSSGGTGITGGNTGNYYYYAETTGSSTSGHKYWLKSPEITITSNNLAISYYIGHLGDNVGSYNVYLDVIS